MSVLDDKYNRSRWSPDKDPNSEIIRARRAKATAVRRGAISAIKKFRDIPGCDKEADAITAYLNTLEGMIKITGGT